MDKLDKDYNIDQARGQVIDQNRSQDVDQNRSQDVDQNRGQDIDQARGQVIDPNIDQNKCKPNDQSKNRNKGRITRKLSHRAIIALCFGILAAAIVIAVISCNYLSYTNVNLDDMLQVSLSGYNGKGSVKADVTSPVQFADFAKTVKAVPDKNTDLKNGDSITITWEYDKAEAKAQKLRVQADPVTYEISGLKDARIIDNDELFKDISVNASGISPYITLSVENKSTDEFIKDVVFAVESPKEYYTAGDTYVISASYDTEKALSMCCEPDGTDGKAEKTYTISAGDSYLTDPSELSQDALDEMNQAASKLFTDGKAREYGLRIFSEMGLMPVWSGTSTTFRWVSPTLISAYFNIRSNDSDNTVMKHINDVRLVYNAVLTQQDGTSCNAEVVVRFEDLIKKTDGSIDAELDSGTIISASAKNSNIKKMVSISDDGFDEAKIALE